jgi:subtilisin family serine protease
MTPASAQAAAHMVAAPPGLTISKVDDRLKKAHGQIDVWVTLDTESLAARQAALAGSAGIERAKILAASASEASIKKSLGEHRQILMAQQASVAQGLAGLGARELGRVHVAHNAIAVRIDASQLSQIASMPGVAKVRPVINYELALSETVPYVGGSAVQASGIDGTGVKVAVLDTGVDYTHRNLGGPGTTAAYDAAYGADTTDPKNTTRDGLFPTAKVIEGFDFVGETWGVTAGVEFGTRTEDPDPIDFNGHGTHVADIVAGKSLDGTHVGMAPGAKLLAGKVCSALSTACNGIALLKGVDFALDPNGDGDIGDAADVISMSIGSAYGEIEDDLTEACADAVRLGVVVVTAAGNEGNKPYIVSSPSIGLGVISVAQTQVPSAKGYPLVVHSPAAIAGAYGNTVLLDFAPIGAGVTGDVAFVGRGCPAGSITANNPDDPYLASPAGKIALIDRGACPVSLKIDRAAKAGAIGVLIGLVAPGDAVGFSFGGGDTFVPALVIQQVLSNAIKAQLAAAQTVNASFSPAFAIALVGSMASTSARGPSYSTQAIKPEIGAPGASVSAEVGTGNGETAFGGTSGATPMVSGAAALLLQAFPNRSPEQIKAMLMNSAETTIYTDPVLRPGELAPITRIGAGELRVNRAIGLNAIAWNLETKSAALSFGQVEVPGTPVVLVKKLRVENFTNTTRTYTIARGFRFADDQASHAVSVLAPGSVTVGPRGRTDIAVTLVIDGRKLPSWVLNGGSQGGNGAALNGQEFDGYVTLTSGNEKLSVPWQVLPRKASATFAGPVVKLKKSDGINLFNLGVEDGDFDIFSLTGASPRVPSNELPQPGDNFEVIDLRSVGVRFLPESLVGLDVLEFAMSTYGRRSHPNYPAEFDIYIDTTGDGIPDFVAFNAENAGFGASGQNLVYLADLTAGTATAYFYTDADLDSGNVIFSVPMFAMGLSPGTTINFSVYAFDNYFTGNLTDQVENMFFTPGNARFAPADGVPFGTVPTHGHLTVPVTATSVPASMSSESGLLLMYRRNTPIESEVVKIR